MKRERMDRDDWIVAIRVRQFGDVLTTLEALRALKCFAPDRKVAFVADERFHVLLRRFDFIDLLLAAPPKLERPGSLADYLRYLRVIRDLNPSAILDFHGSSRTALLSRLSGAAVRIGFNVRIRSNAYNVVVRRAEINNGKPVKRDSGESAFALARRAGVGEVAPGPATLKLAQDERRRGAELLAGAGVRPRHLSSGVVVGINPGRSYPSKEWPAERFAELGRKLVERGNSVVVMWGPGEEEDARAIAGAIGEGATVAPPTSLTELPAVVAALGALITIDSGLKHLAVCLGVPTLTLFGSTDPREWHIGRAHDAYLWRGYSCSPCRRRACPIGTPCMDFAVTEVLGAMDDMKVVAL